MYVCIIYLYLVCCNRFLCEYVGAVALFFLWVLSHRKIPQIRIYQCWKPSTSVGSVASSGNLLPLIREVGICSVQVLPTTMFTKSILCWSPWRCWPPQVPVRMCQRSCLSCRWNRVWVQRKWGGRGGSAWTGRRAKVRTLRGEAPLKLAFHRNMEHWLASCPPSSPHDSCLWAAPHSELLRSVLFLTQFYVWGGGNTAADIWCSRRHSGTSPLPARTVRPAHKETSCSQAAVETFPEASFLTAAIAVTSIWLPLVGSVLHFGLSLTSQSVVKLSRRLSEGFTFLYFYFSNDSIPAGLTYGWERTKRRQIEVLRMCWK